MATNHTAGGAGMSDGAEVLAWLTRFAEAIDPRFGAEAAQLTAAKLGTDAAQLPLLRFAVRFRIKSLRKSAGRRVHHESVAARRRSLVTHGRQCTDLEPEDYLACLGEEGRAVVELLVNGATQAEVAKMLGVSPPTVSRLYKKYIQQIRERFGLA